MATRREEHADTFHCVKLTEHSIIYLLVGLLITGLMAGCLSESNPPPPPTDNELIQLFNDKKEIFFHLRDKICKDGYTVVSLDPKWSDPDQIPRHIKQEYYKLFREINVKQVRRTQNGMVMFPVWSTGNVSGGDSKGYVFKPDPDWPREERESLDDVLHTGKELFYKRKIDEDWYLYYDRFL